ncbi:MULTISPECIES: hypothetical protein [Aeromicrobium]|uniref:Uncharacterized protein n=1 Tax=Aeromicrobium phoceense TaxID=2754045 RepID=A0A838XEZ3_9ACTN|nr:MULTISPECIES: hypothetical protein [Aeromicrobium]MBA4609115.1 hypothetical protein [Aeromicrobium phoceense]MBA4609162.1 hypothetical protein [Aeromicrobium phoceense]
MSPFVAFQPFSRAAPTARVPMALPKVPSHARPAAWSFVAGSPGRQHAHDEPGK